MMKFCVTYYDQDHDIRSEIVEAPDILCVDCKAATTEDIISIFLVNN